MLAAFKHAIECGQVLAVFYGVLGPLEYLLSGVVRHRIQPQFFDLLELLCIRVGRIILVVVVQSEQGKDLVDGLYACFRRGAAIAALSSLPRRCR